MSSTICCEESTGTTVLALTGTRPQRSRRTCATSLPSILTRGLPRDAIVRLVGKMAHPLNRPRLDATKEAGSSRVMACCSRASRPPCRSVPKVRVFQRVFSSRSGIDPYASAVSDVYQDLFGEGSYSGKGIYDIDAFEAALQGRVPDSTMLSHDLFEGIFARSGLVSDIEVVEEFQHAMTWRRRASIAGREATGSFCPG